MAASLNLPNELILKIAEFLPPADLCSLFLANRHLTALLVTALLDSVCHSRNKVWGNKVFFAAANRGDKAQVRRMIQGGVLEFLADHGVLSEAVLYHSERAIRTLLECGVDTEVEDWVIKRTALFTAVDKGRLDAVRVLLDRQWGVNVNAKDTIGETPLFLAVREGKKEIVQLLLSDERVDLRPSLNRMGWISLLAASGAGDEGVIRTLLADGKFDENYLRENSGTLLHTAVLHGHIDVVRALLEDPRIDVNASSWCGVGFPPQHPMAPCGKTALHLAVCSDSSALLKLIVSHERIQPDLRDKEGRTPLSLAVLSGQKQSIPILLSDPRIDINAIDIHRATPLHHAVSRNSPEMVRLLLSDPRLCTNLAGFNQEAPLHVAAQNGFEEIVKVLMNDPRTEINCLEYNGRTPLMSATIGGSASIVKLMLDDGRADVNARCYRGLTAVYIAAALDRAEVMELLMGDDRVKVRGAGEKGGLVAFLEDAGFTGHAIEDAHKRIERLALPGGDEGLLFVRGYECFVLAVLIGWKERMGRSWGLARMERKWCNRGILGLWLITWVIGISCGSFASQP